MGVDGAGNRAVVVVALRLEGWAIGRPVEVSGMGLARAGAAAARLRRRLPAEAPVVLSGLCGAVAPLAPGTLVVATAVQGPDGERRRLDHAGTMLQVLADWSGPVVDGLLLSAERVVTGRARRALAANGALAVDMETSAWVEALAGRRLAVVRVVADGPDVGMVRGGLRGLRTLRRLRPLLERWAGDGGAPN